MQGEKLKQPDSSKKKHGHHHFGGIASTIEYLKREKKSKTEKEKQAKVSAKSAAEVEAITIVPKSDNSNEQKHKHHHSKKSSASKSTQHKEKKHAHAHAHDHEHKEKHKKHKHKKEKPTTATSNSSDAKPEEILQSETTDPNILSADSDLTAPLSTDEKKVTPVDEQPPLKPVSSISHPASEGEKDQVSKLALILSQKTADFPPLPQGNDTLETDEIREENLNVDSIKTTKNTTPQFSTILIMPSTSKELTESSTPPMPESPRVPSRVERFRNWSGVKFNQGYGLAENYIPGFRWIMNRVVKPTAHGLYAASAWTVNKTNQYVVQPTLNYVAKPLWNKVGSPIWQRTGQPVWNGLNGYIIQPAWNGLKGSARWVGNLFTRKSNKPTEGLGTSPSVSAPSSKPDVADAAINSTGKGWFSTLPSLPLPSFLKKAPATPSTAPVNTEKPKPT